MTPLRGTVGTVVIRAWVEADGGPGEIRARVLAISGPEAEMQNLGAAAGMPAILKLVDQGLRTAMDLGEKQLP